MKALHLPLLAALCTALLLPSHHATAVEKDGYLVEISHKSLERNDTGVSYYREVDRTLTLRARIKNTGFKPKESGKIRYSIFVKKWGMQETESIQMISGEEELPAILPAREVMLELGEYHIGGHMHGTSKIHMDDLLGWKLSLEVEGKTIDMASSSKVPTWEKRASKGNN